MKSDTPLDYAVFQLSPKHSRCELFVFSDGSTEKIASGLLKPFVSHLQTVEEQLASASQSVKLEVRQRNAETWFTKGTLERFVRFVSTPEVLELVSTFDAEMSQLEAARRIYSQVSGSQISGGGGPGVTAADDATKNELLRAIDVRLLAVRQDLSTACARAAAAGFNVDSVSELQMFADKFGAHRLNEACGKFMSLSERRPEVIQPSNSGHNDSALRSSYGSDMSIDDDLTSAPHQEPATCQHPNPPAVSFPLNHTFSRESIEDGKTRPNKTIPVKDKKDESSNPDQTFSIQASQPTRRLSVQDRINMFENKQKENSGGKPAVVMKSVELRRMSSDLSGSGVAAEKAVLRRWSGASDMSIDFSADKKDTESPSYTRASTVISQDQKVSNSNDDKPEIKVIPSLGRVSARKSDSNLGSVESDDSKHQMLGKIQSRSFVSRVDDQECSEENSKTETGREIEGVVGFKNQGKLDGSLSGEESFISKSDKKLEVPNRTTFNQREDLKSRDKSIKQNRKATQRTAVQSGVVENDAGSKIKKAFAARYKGIEGDSSSSSAQKEVKFVGDIEDSLNRKGLTDELNTKAQYFDSFSTPPPDQVQKIKPSKGNQELNDELKMKASELEILFAEHKLRAPKDESNSAHKGGLGERETQNEVSSILHYTKSVQLSEDDHQSPIPTRISKNNSSKLSVAASSVKTIDTVNEDFSGLSIQEGSRGKLYDRYMQKRNAKLEEEWSSNRAGKEARLKSMEDSLERNRSEMKDKISGYADKQDSVSSIRRRAERLRSYNTKSIMKTAQQDLDFGSSEDDDEAFDFQNRNRDLDNTSVMDGGTHVRKLLLANKSSSLTTPRTTSAAPAPKSATKTYANYGKRRMQMEKSLVQSVPNFSDLRKENARPSSKTNRSQVRNYARSKSTNDEAAIAREDKSRRSHSVRRSSANPIEFGEMSYLDSDGVNLAPIKFDVDITKNVSTKPFLKKGSRASFVSQTSIAREKTSSVSEFVKNKEETDDVESEPDEFASAGKNEIEEEFESEEEDRKSIKSGESEPEMIIKSELQNGDINTLVSQLPTVDSTHEWPEESPVSWNYSHHRQNPFSYPHETSDIEASADSPIGSPTSWNLNSFNQIDADSARMRKKWGTAQKPTLVVHSSNNLPIKDMKSGFKRLLKFGRKSRGSDILVDWVSATTSEGDDDIEDGRDPANRSSEDLRKSRMGFSHAQPSEDSFAENDFFNESVQSSQISTLAPTANFKLREERVSGSSIKAPRSFFSLSTFRSKGSDSKPR